MPRLRFSLTTAVTAAKVATWGLALSGFVGQTSVVSGADGGNGGGGPGGRRDGADGNGGGGGTGGAGGDSGAGGLTPGQGD